MDLTWKGDIFMDGAQKKTKFRDADGKARLPPSPTVSRARRLES